MMFPDHKHKLAISTAIVLALAMPASFAQISNPTTVLATEDSSSDHKVSIQKLYGDVYDQETGQSLGRYLIATARGYTDSPHEMFNYHLPQIKGYGYIANASLVPVDWKNPSGVTDMKIYVVKKSSALYKKVYGQNSSSSKKNQNSSTPKRKVNEDGLPIIGGEVSLHDLYHAYRSFLGYPCPGDQAGQPADAHLLYLFQKYFGYNPNISKKQNYKDMDKNIQKADQKLKAKNKKSNQAKDSKENKDKKKAKKKDKKKTKDKEKKSKAKADLTTYGLSAVGLVFAVILFVGGFKGLKKARK